MAKAVHATRWIWGVATICQKQHARCAQREKSIARPNDTNADCTSRIVAAASNNRNAGHTPSFRELCPQLARYFVALI